MTTHTYVTRAWSCTVRLVVGDGRALAPAAADLTALLDRIDRMASRFRADSALSAANANAGRPVPIPRLLGDLVKASLDAAAQTGGAVDPTVGLAMHRIGYDRDIAAIPADGPAIAASPRRRSWQDVRLHREAGLLVVPPSPRGGWPVRVAEHENGPGQVVVLRHGGLATSTTTIRRWLRGERSVHHIVDPRTGTPADGPWRTASVYAPSALAANVASTAAIVLGERAVEWLTTRQLAARLVDVDGFVDTTPGWPVHAHAETAAA